MTRRTTIRSRRLTLVPLAAAAAADLLAGETGDLALGSGWPHDGTFDGIRSALESGDPDALPWLVQLGDPGLDDPGLDDSHLDDAAHRHAVIGDLGWKGVPGPGGNVEIGYGIAAPYRRKGYGSEAVGVFLGWLDQQPDVSHVRAEVLADNLASRRLLERLEFTVSRVDGAYLWYERPTRGQVGWLTTSS